MRALQGKPLLLLLRFKVSMHMPANENECEEGKISMKEIFNGNYMNRN